MGRAAHFHSRGTHRLTAYDTPLENSDDAPDRGASCGSRHRGLASRRRPRRFARTRRSQDRLAKALRVPHVSAASSAAVAVDLGTGEQLFATERHAPARAGVEREARRSRTRSSSRSARRCGSRRRSRRSASRRETTLHRRPRARRRRRPDALEQRPGASSRAAFAPRGSGMSPAASSGTSRSSTRSARAAAGSASFYIDESPPLSALVVDRALVPASTRRAGRRRLPRSSSATRSARRASPSTAASPCGRRRSRRAARREDALARRSASIVGFMDLHSDNFTAEELLKLLGARDASGRARPPRGARAVVMHALKAGGISDGRRQDRRRLRASRSTTASPSERSSASCRRSPRTPALESGAAARAARRRRQRHAAGPACGADRSSGTSSRRRGRRAIASSLSGYVNSRIAFAIIQNGHPLSYWWAREAQDRFAKRPSDPVASAARPRRGSACRPSAPSSASSCPAPRRR